MVHLLLLIEKEEARIKYRQLTQEQRYQMDGMLRVGTTQTEIANALVLHKSTISLQLKRNAGIKGWLAKQADTMARERRLLNDHHATRLTGENWECVDALLRKRYSPKQISSRRRL